MGVGYHRTPGIWSEAQIAAWKKITEAVHQKGGRIFLQLWHVGRVSHPLFLQGQLPVAPSAVQPKGHVSLIRPETPFVTPRALTLDEIAQTIETYRQAAQNAKAEGFDGVELHAANGYLIDQFLQDTTNQRDDEYGGSIENRARFLLEVTDAVIGVWGSGRVGVHLAPRCDSHDMGDSDPLATFSYAVNALNTRHIAFIFAREMQGPEYIGDQLKRLFNGVYIANQGLSLQDGEQLLQQGHADAIGFGKLFIANPDLPKRLSLNLPLNEVDANTFYVGGERGYNDYSFHVSD